MHVTASEPLHVGCDSSSAAVCWPMSYLVRCSCSAPSCAIFLMCGAGCIQMQPTATPCGRCAWDRTELCGRRLQGGTRRWEMGPKREARGLDGQDCCWAPDAQLIASSLAWSSPHLIASSFAWYSSHLIASSGCGLLLRSWMLQSSTPYRVAVTPPTTR